MINLFNTSLVHSEEEKSKLASEAYGRLGQYSFSVTLRSALVSTITYLFYWNVSRENLLKLHEWSMPEGYSPLKEYCFEVVGKEAQARWRLDQTLLQYLPFPRLKDYESSANDIIDISESYQIWEKALPKAYFSESKKRALGQDFENWDLNKTEDFLFLVSEIHKALKEETSDAKFIVRVANEFKKLDSKHWKSEAFPADQVMNILKERFDAAVGADWAGQYAHDYNGLEGKALKDKLKFHIAYVPAEWQPANYEAIDTLAKSTVDFWMLAWRAESLLLHLLRYGKKQVRERGKLRPITSAEMSEVNSYLKDVERANNKIIGLTPSLIKLIKNLDTPGNTWSILSGVTVLEPGFHDPMHKLLCDGFGSEMFRLVAPAEQRRSFNFPVQERLPTSLSFL